jgi:hypothetical protein
MFIYKDKIYVKGNKTAFYFKPISKYVKHYLGDFYEIEVNVNTANKIIGFLLFDSKYKSEIVITKYINQLYNIFKYEFLNYMAYNIDLNIYIKNHSKYFSDDIKKQITNYKILEKI